MLFNSFTFAIFLPLVLVVYYLLGRRLSTQNIWLLVASYFFYAWWDWRFLSLLLGATLVAYLCGAAIAKSNDPLVRRTYLLVAIGINVAVLGYFKYYNFFKENLVDLLSLFGVVAESRVLDIVLPVGISFFVFQGLSYVIDVYRRDIEPVRSFLDFAVFKAYFPQLVAGPIERAGHMMPQFQSTRVVSPEQVSSGIFMILWGLFKKVVIADNLVTIVDPVFANYSVQSGADLAIGILAFTFQIYCDFSGYTDIARGIAKLMGIELVLNFNLPYFAANPSDFWRRWHISLSRWLRDYVYIPMGGGRGSRLNVARNLAATMLLGGLWHGAAWNFVAWGAYHGCLLAAYHAVKAPLQYLVPPRLLSVPTLPVRMASMFFLTVIGWVFFRATSIDQALFMIAHIGLDVSADTVSRLLLAVGCIVPLVLFEVFLYMRPKQVDQPFRSVSIQAGFNAILICLMMVFASRTPSEFIYFDF